MTNRLRELASEAAKTNHIHALCIQKPEGHVGRLYDWSDVNEGFDTCPHPDCVLVRTPEATEHKHRCSGCGLTWSATEAGSVAAELCGECWRKVQPILHRTPEATGLPSKESLNQTIGQLVAQRGLLLAALGGLVDVTQAVIPHHLRDEKSRDYLPSLVAAYERARKAREEFPNPETIIEATRESRLREAANTLEKSAQ